MNAKGISWDMEKNRLHDFFSDTSRIILFFPLVILILGVLVRMSSSDKPLVAVIFPPAQVQQKTTQMPQIKTEKAEFAPVLPFACDYRTKSASVSAYRDGPSFRAHVWNGNVAANYLLSDDCLYIWNTGDRTGEKQCGMKTNVVIFDKFISSGVTNIRTVVEYIPKHILPVDIGGILATCKNVPSQKAGLFAFPKGVTFAEKKSR